MTRTTFFSLLLTFSLSIGAAPAPNQAAVMPNLPLGSYANGQAMMQEAMSRLVLDVGVTFLNKDYEKDVYVREPVTGNKVRVSCVRFRANSGFRFKMDPPMYSLTPQQLTLSANIAKIRADGLAFKFMLGPCNWIGAGMGLQLDDVKVVYKARPILSFNEGGCRLVWNNDPNGVTVSIGDLNVLGVQNDLDKLAKDAVREALNAALDAFFGSALRGELQKVVIKTCGSPKK
jgi:hypothetical protein